MNLFNSHSHFCERKMSAATILQLFIITLVSLPNLSVQQLQPKDYTCTTKEKCDECIRTYGCVWCSDPNAKYEKRCQLQGDSKCAAQFLIDPKIETVILAQKPLTDVKPRRPGGGGGFGTDVSTGSSQDTITQVSPQHVHVKIRPNKDHPTKFPLTYRQAVDYPVDLYYLMDLSKSMEDDKEKLSSLGDHLAKTMTELTSNFRLGFGSFVDKVAMPYVSIVPKNLISPCPGCAAPYGFRNVMSLSTDTSKFAGQVKSANVSGNLDAPEGGFDAIMQAVVCSNEIGWRPRSRKLLVFSTDSSFHYAGDGKLAGIIKPNDGCCHLDSSGMYTHSTIQDYPSIAQISTKVKENSINLIFAVTKPQQDLYTRLSSNIQGSFCDVLSEDSSNVVELVKQQYEKITSSIEMHDSDLGDNMRIRYYSRCLNPAGELVETNKCDGLKVGQTVEFEVALELLSCPSDPSKWHQSFTIYPVGVGENLTVEVDLLCDCPCNNDPTHPSYEMNSPRCSGHGTLKCGVCECYEGFQGEDCNCTTDAEKIDGCRPDPNAPLCSAHGTCKCNKCICDTYSESQAFWGPYCECNNFTCPRTGGKLCSDHGDCVCGACKCHEGWTGDDCSCEDSTSNCVSGPGDFICSGHGKCVCNKCECDVVGSYSGKFCDKCPSCTTKCDELKDCVQCRVHQSGALNKEECAKCPYNITIVDTLEVKDEYYYCSRYDEQDCRFTYIYEIHGNRIDVIAEKNLKCPPQARILGVVFTVILSIVLIGLAFLMIWKIFTSMRDRREFAKFERERMMAKWDTGQNPIYKQATSTFKNPTYCGN